MSETGKSSITGVTNYTSKADVRWEEKVQVHNFSTTDGVDPDEQDPVANLPFFRGEERNLREWNESQNTYLSPLLPKDKTVNAVVHVELATKPGSNEALKGDSLQLCVFRPSTGPPVVRHQASGGEGAGATFYKGGGGMKTQKSQPRYIANLADKECSLQTQVKLPDAAFFDKQKHPKLPKNSTFILTPS